MPDEALFHFAFDATPHDGVRAFVLLVSADDFDQTRIALVWAVDREVAVDVEYDIWRDHRKKAVLHVVEGPFAAHAVRKPRSPFVKRRAKPAIAELLALRRNVEDIRDEGLRRALFVVEDVARAVRPADGRAHGRLRFAQHHREAIDEEGDVETVRPAVKPPLGVVRPFADGDASVVSWIGEVEERNRSRHVVRSARERVGAEYPFAQELVPLHKVSRVDQALVEVLNLPDDFVRLRRSHSLVLVEEQERLLEPVGDKRKSAIVFVRDLRRLHGRPAVQSRRLIQHSLYCVCLVEGIHCFSLLSSGFVE